MDEGITDGKCAMMFLDKKVEGFSLFIPTAGQGRRGQIFFNFAAAPTLARD